MLIDQSVHFMTTFRFNTVNHRLVNKSEDNTGPVAKANPRRVEFVQLQKLIAKLKCTTIFENTTQ